MRQSLRSIRLFVAVYEELSFTLAAQRENATQSGVSQHVSDLEEALGVRLFTRSVGSVRPTPAGSAYYGACIDVLKAHERATRAVKPFQGSRVGELSVGLMPSMTRSVLAPAYVRYEAANPNVVVRVIDAYSGELTERVRAGEMSFAIVPAAPASAGLRATLFARTPELLVSGPSSGMRHSQPIALAAQAPLKLVVPGAGNARRQLIESYLAQTGTTVERLLEFDTMFGTLDLVGNGGWSAILPGVMMAPDLAREGGRYTINPIVDPPFLLELYLIEPARRVMPEPAAEFLECLRAEMERVNAQLDAWAGAPARAAAATRAVTRPRKPGRASRSAPTA